MRLFLADIFALLAAVSGWFYLFYSNAAVKLSGLEPSRRNTLRGRLRRINGLMMFLLAVGFFAGFNTVDDERTPRAFVIVWMGVILLLFLITILVMVDMRLTWKLRHTPRTGSRQ